MSDLDLLIAALTGTAATPERTEEAARHLVMLRSLLAEVRDRRPALVPSGADGWRSTAADRYLERLDTLRATLASVEGALAGAESELETCIANMRAELAAYEEAVRVEERRALDLQADSVRQDASRAQRVDVDGAAAWTTR